MAFQTRSGVAGSSICSTPNSASASTIAFARAASPGVIPPSALSVSQALMPDTHEDGDRDPMGRRPEEVCPYSRPGVPGRLSGASVIAAAQASLFVWQLFLLRRSVKDAATAANARKPPNSKPMPRSECWS